MTKRSLADNGQSSMHENGGDERERMSKRPAAAAAAVPDAPEIPAAAVDQGSMWGTCKAQNVNIGEDPEEAKRCANAVLAVKWLEGQHAMSEEGKTKFLTVLQEGANPKFEHCILKKNLMQSLYENMKRFDPSFLGECMRILHANASSLAEESPMKDDYDLVAHFAEYPQMLYTFMDADEHCCALLKNVPINLEEHPVDATEGLGLMSYALKHKAFATAKFLSDRLSSLACDVISQWKRYAEMRETVYYPTGCPEKQLLFMIWKKIIWKDSALKKTCGVLMYKILLLSPGEAGFHERLKLLKKRKVDITLQGGVFQYLLNKNVRTALLPKESLMLILDAFNPDHLCRKLNWEFFHGLSKPHVSMSDLDKEFIERVCRKISSKVRDNPHRETLANAGTRWSTSKYSNEYLTTIVKEYNHKVAVYYQLYLGFHATGSFFGDARVSKFQKELMTMGCMYTDTEDVSTCPICLEIKDNGSRLTKLSGCCHVYHEDCVAGFVKDECPACRIPFSPKDNISFLMAS